MTDTLAHHRQYLLQGVMNFFMEQGKVALVASQDAATQAWFEGELQKLAPALLGCKIIHLHARPDEDALQTFNALLARISLQQATQASGQAQANYLLWVSENEHFTPERFQLLKSIILQFSGLQLKLFVSVTSDRWNERLFDIAERKIAYWYIPASTPQPALALPAAAASLPAAHTTDKQVAASASGKPTADTPKTAAISQSQPTAPTRNLNLWVPATGVLVLLVAATYWLNDSAQYSEPSQRTKASAQIKNEASVPSAPKTAPAPTAVTDSPAAAPQQTPAAADLVANSANKNAAPATAKAAMVETGPLPASNAEVASSSASVSANIATPSAVPPAAVLKSVSSTPPAVQSMTINTQADCPTSAENLPTAKPSNYNKDTNYIFIKSPQSLKICIASAGRAYKLVDLRSAKGTRIYGKIPWRVYSPDLLQVELYFQGARVLLDSSIIYHVQVVPY